MDRRNFLVGLGIVAAAPVALITKPLSAVHAYRKARGIPDEPAAMKSGSRWKEIAMKEDMEALEARLVALIEQTQLEKEIA